MDTDYLPDIESVVEMMRFWVAFAVSPAEALAPYEGLGDLSPRLFTLMASGVLISAFIVYVLDKMDWASDDAMTRAIFGSVVARLTGAKLNPPVLVFAVTLLMFLLVVALHLLAVSWVWVDQWIRLLSANFGRSVFDSLNAAAAFLACFIPLATVCAVVAGVLGQRRREWSDRIAEWMGTGLGIVAMIYLPWALSAVHPDTSYMQAMAALGGWPVGLILLSFAISIVWRIVKRAAGR